MTTTFLLTILEALPALICGSGLLCDYWLVMKSAAVKARFVGCARLGDQDPYALRYQRVSAFLVLPRKNTLRRGPDIRTVHR